MKNKMEMLWIVILVFCTHSNLIFRQSCERLHIERYFVVEKHFGFVRISRLFVVGQTFVDQVFGPTIVAVQLYPVQHRRVIVASF